jgi:hypothetical protein
VADGDLCANPAIGMAFEFTDTDCSPRPRSSHKSATRRFVKPPFQGNNDGSSSFSTIGLRSPVCRLWRLGSDPSLVIRTAILRRRDLKTENLRRQVERQGVDRPGVEL